MWGVWMISPMAMPCMAKPKAVAFIWDKRFFEWVHAPRRAPGMAPRGAWASRAEVLERRHRSKQVMTRSTLLKNMSTAPRKSILTIGYFRPFQ